MVPVTAATLAPAGTDLSFVTFGSGKKSESCRFRTCTAEALYVAFYQKLNNACRHSPRMPYCIAHKDLILDCYRNGHGFFCPDCPESRFLLLRIEPLR